ncbi:MAG: type II secretion system protein [Phycisphaerae bacterium]|nr:type II secretion system protein [Phycisphaerae bacterium]
MPALASARRAFTLIELLVAILVLAVLIGLLIVGLRAASRTARGAADLATLTALKNATTQFKQIVGFAPPLADDAMGPLVGASTVVKVFRLSDFSPGGDVERLRTPPVDPNVAPDLRFSIYSIPIYLIGVLDAPVDGKAGPGLRIPKKEGSFEKAGKILDPFFDVSRNAKAIFAVDAARGRYVLRDGKGVAFRYYFWLHDAGDPPSNTPLKDYLNIPWIVGDESNPDLRDAQWAVVSAGPDGVFGDEDLLPPTHPQFLTLAQMQTRMGAGSLSGPALRARAREDNSVEAGR